VTDSQTRADAAIPQTEQQANKSRFTTKQEKTIIAVGSIAVDDDRMTVIQRVYLRAEKGMPVIHDWNVATADAVAASQEALASFFDLWIGTT